MTFDLKEVGITLVVGAYTLYGLELLCWTLFRENIFTRLRAERVVSDTGSVALSLALSFSLGMLMESGSGLLLRGPGSKIKLFERTLAKQVFRSAESRPTPLGLELAGSHLFVRAAGERLAEVEARMCQGLALTPEQQRLLRVATERAYYRAKNVVVGHPQYHGEMMSIQARMNFASAFAGCSVFLAGAFVLGLLIRLLRAVGQREPVSDGAHRWWLTLQQSTLVVAVLALLTTASLFAYVRESGEYTRRALGYYSTLRVERGTDATSSLLPSGAGRTVLEPSTTPSCLNLILVRY
jgi:hypothetical protein